MVSSVDYHNEISVSDEILKRTSDTYRRIRNTVRFLLSNLHGFEPSEHLVPFDELLALDAYIVQQAGQLVHELEEAYTKTQFHVVYQKLHHFCVVTLGNFYLDIIKDRQYTCQTNSLARRSAQTALYHLAEYLVRQLAPILTFTAEEIWQNMPAPVAGARAESVFLSEPYEVSGLLTAKQNTDKKQGAVLTSEQWACIRQIREEVNKALEVARQAQTIGSSLEAEVTLYVNKANQDLLAVLGDELRFVLITSIAKLKNMSDKPATLADSEIEGLAIDVVQSAHTKCIRCWHRQESVGSIAEHPALCQRCVENVAGKGESRLYA